MALTWGEYRTIIRRTILNDRENTNWPNNDTLLDCIGWALDAFCAHTAVPTSIVYTSVSQQFTAPENLFGDLASTGRLYLTTSSRFVAIPSLDLLAKEDTGLVFSVYGDNVVLSEDPSTLYSGGKLFYFAYYNHPVLDSDTIDIPVWARNAVAHLVGAYAITQNAMLIAQINQWKSREDAGTPVQNAIEVQQKWMLKFYENELARYPNQKRENYYERLLVT